MSPPTANNGYLAVTQVYTFLQIPALQTQNDHSNVSAQTVKSLEPKRRPLESQHNQ